MFPFLQKILQVRNNCFQRRLLFLFHYTMRAFFSPEYFTLRHKNRIDRSMRLINEERSWNGATKELIALMEVLFNSTN